MAKPVSASAALDPSPFGLRIGQLALNTVFSPDLSSDGSPLIRDPLCGAKRPEAHSLQCRIIATLLSLGVLNCTWGEPNLGSPAHFKMLIGIAAEVDGPIFSCRIEAFPDVSMVAAYQLPPAVAKRLRDDPKLLAERPMQFEWAQDRVLIPWSASSPSGEAALAISDVIPTIEYVADGDCEGSYDADNVRSEISAIGSPDVRFSVEYKKVQDLFTVIDLLVLDLNAERLYMIGAT